MSVKQFTLIPCRGMVLWQGYRFRRRRVKNGRRKMAGKNWQIEGRYVEYCSCDYGCPCETMANPTYGYCTGLVAFKIDNGWCEDVRLDDLTVAATFYLPRALHHGQGIMQPMLDERATEAQREALFYILSGADQPVGTVFQIFGDRDDQRSDLCQDRVRMGSRQA